MSFEFFVARRYLFSKRKQAFIYVISLMSVLGVALGVAALVIVLGVYNGLTTDMREKILGANAHGMVLSTLPDGFALDPGVMDRVLATPGVTGATPFIYSEVMLSAGTGVKGLILRGIDPVQAPKVLSMLQTIKRGSVEDLARADTPPGIILGEELTKRLGLALGSRINLLSPSGQRSTSGFQPRIRPFVVVGIFKTGMYEYDSSLAFLSPVPALDRMLREEQKAAFFRHKNELRNVVRCAIRSRNIHWCYACCPNSSWAQTLFPDRAPSEALSLLWEQTLEFCFLKREDPLDAWLSYYDGLYRKTRWLNSLGLEEIHFYNGAGTDLTVGVNPRCIWEGGLDRSRYDGTYFQCNLPSFEICTTTDRRRAKGHVAASKPLFVNGGMIQGFSFDFRNGKAVNAHAEVGE